MWLPRRNKHHCRSGATLIEKNGSMQAQTDTSCVFLKTELNVVQLKRTPTWPLPRDSVLVTCPFLLVRWPVWREIFTFSDDNSVCDSVLAPWRCENFDASRTVSLIAANLGKDFQK